MKYHFPKWAAILCLGLWPCLLTAQQIATVHHQILRDNIANPAWFQAGPLSQVTLGYQQRQLYTPGWTSATEYIRYLSRPLTANPRFCWGIWATHDQIHTENKFALAPTISAQVIENAHWEASLGISAGIVSTTSNFNTARRHDLADPFLTQSNSLLELDAGLGGTVKYHRPKLSFQADIMATQLPGNVLQDRPLFPALPHWLGSAQLMVQPVFNFSVGPRIFHRNIFGRSDTTYTALPGSTDLGMVGSLDRQHLWFAASYRWDASAVSAGVGFQIMAPDTVAKPYNFASFVDVQAFFSYPLAPGLVPTAELGLTINLGYPKKRNLVDTLEWARPFWKTESWMTEHKESYLAPNGPYELEAFQQISNRNVYLSFEFPDMNLRYAGDAILFEDSLVRRIGLEWEGMDGLMQGLVRETITEALAPDTTRIRDQENLEPLQNLSWIEFFTSLRLDEEGASFCSDVVYEGEIKGSFTHGDSLLVPIVVDDRDTVLIVQKGKCMTSLELAAVKLWVLRSRFHYAFDQVYGDRFRLIYEGSYIDPFDPDNRPPIRCKKLRIKTNHPHMQVFQTNFIDLKFRRYKEFVDESDPQWTPRVPDLPGDEWTEQDPSDQ